MSNAEKVAGSQDSQVPDGREIELVKAAIGRDLTVAQRIGMGLRALHNFLLFERVPEEFQKRLDMLRNQERSLPE